LESNKEEVATASQQVNELERSVNDKKREVDKLKSELQSLKKKHDSDIRSLRESHDNAQLELASKQAKHSALRLLAREKAVSFPELKVIDALREKPTTTMQQLETTTQLKRNDIESIIKPLAKKAILQYDSKAGDIRVLRHLED
jgi:predicted RNase H-like nuclease (RuvC/YqgF family)